MPTLVPIVDAALPPRVEITFEAAELSGTISTITVFQISSDGQTIVKDAERRNAIGGFFVVDYMPPLGVDVTYQAEQFNAAGVSLGLTASASTQLSVQVGDVIIQDPLAPRSWVRLRAEKSFASNLSRSRDLSVQRRGLETIALMGEIGLLEQVPLGVVTESENARKSLADVLDEGYVLIRTMPPMPVPRLLHAAIETAAETPVTFRAGGHASIWPLSGMQVSPSPVGIVESVVTWQQYIDAFPTWQTMDNAYTTWFDAKRNPPPEA